MTSELLEEEAQTAPQSAVPAPDPTARAAAVVFAAAMFAGFVWYVVEARNVWFFYDDWEFLAGKKFNISDLLHQHGGHFVALPLATYRLMFFVFGLRGYLPYQLLTIGLHLTAALLLRVFMRRAGVHPWVATTAAGSFVFLGSASQDILWAFQITFSGALVLGLVQLLLADHDGPIDRRDWFGLGAGLCAVMCSGVAVAMVGVVGLSVLIRRGWRIAAFHVVPLALVYVAWYVSHGRTGAPTVTSPSKLWDWTHTAIAGAFDALGEVRFVGWALGVLLVVGLVLAWRNVDRVQFQRQFAAPAAMLVGALAFIVISGMNRAWAGIEIAASSRYMHIVVALLMPALAIAADAVIRRWRASTVFVFALLLIGVPGNIRATGTNFPSRQTFTASEQLMRSLPRLALAQQVPRDLQPDIVHAPSATVGWILDTARSGRLPATRPPTPSELAGYELRLSLDQSPGGSGVQSPGASGVSCQRLTQPVEFNFLRGESFVVFGTVGVGVVGDAPGTSSFPATYGASLFAGAGYHTVKNVGIDMTVRVVSRSANAILCGSHIVQGR
jgi:hypothetical protein